MVRRMLVTWCVAEAEAGGRRGAAAVIDRAAQAIDSVQPLSHLQLQQHHVYLVRVFKL